eukprot:gene17040-biopygen4842
MNTCHEEGVRDRNRAGIEAADPARSVTVEQKEGESKYVLGNVSLFH